MPTRKQRRRKQKEQRHEYVWEDEEGNVVEPEDAKGQKGEPSGRRAALRSAREPQPPSWQRTLKRGIVFAPVMFIVVYLLGDDLTLVEQLTQTAIIVGIFVPFSFLLDSVMYRSYKKREARARQAGSDRGS